MKGIDISHYQGRPDFEKVKSSGYEFVIQKCTQGTGYVDPTYTINRDECRKSGLLFGAYHFANGTDPIAEADHFTDHLGELQSGELVVLDWEIAHADPVGWCKKFLDEVTKQLGFRPMIYLNSSTASRYNWSPVVNGNYGLWIANYGLNICTTLGRAPGIGKWPFYAIWQYCSRGRVSGILGNVDLNYSKMDIETMKKYGKPRPVVTCNHQCPVHCN